MVNEEDDCHIHHYVLMLDGSVFLLVEYLNVTTSSNSC